MLRWRLLLGTVLIAGLVGLLAIDHRLEPPGVVLLPLALLLAVLASQELLALLAARELRPLAWVVYAGNVLIVAANAVPLFGLQDLEESVAAIGWPAAMLGLVVVLAFAGEMRRYERPGAVMERLGLAIFALVYVGLLLSFVAQLRGVAREAGILPLASLLIVAKMSDIGAYAVGRLIGRHKMAPVLSPGKTIEGAAGGIAFACLGSWLTFAWLGPLLARSGQRDLGWGWLAYAVLVAVAAMLGDLAESLIKRDVGRKDSSRWMPGFGGVLDLLDSLLLAAPVAYLCWALGLV